MFDIFALVFLSVAALLIGSLLCTYAYVKIFKGGPYHSEKNPKETDSYYGHHRAVGTPSWSFYRDHPLGRSNTSLVILKRV